MIYKHNTNGYFSLLYLLLCIKLVASLSYLMQVKVTICVRFKKKFLKKKIQSVALVNKTKYNKPN